MNLEEDLADRIQWMQRTLKELEFLDTNCPLQDTLEKCKKTELDDFDAALYKFNIYLRIRRCLNKHTMLKTLLRHALSVVSSYALQPKSLLELSMDKVVKENLPLDSLPRTLLAEVLDWLDKKQKIVWGQIVLLDILVTEPVMSIL